MVEKLEKIASQVEVQSILNQPTNGLYQTNKLYQLVDKYQHRTTDYDDADPDPCDSCDCNVCDL